MASQAPTQDDDDSRQLRQSYTQMLQEAATSASELQLPENIDKLLNLQQRGDQHLEQVKDPRNALADSRLLKMTGGLVLAQANALKIKKEPNANDFVSKLIEVHGVPQEEGGMRMNWKDVGAQYYKYFLRAPPVSFLNGPLRVAGSEVRRRERSSREEKDQSEVQRPEELNADQYQDLHQQTTKRVSGLMRDIHQRMTNAGADALSFVDSFTDKTSFTRTTENLYHACFLVKDGHIGFKVPEKPQNMKEVDLFCCRGTMPSQAAPSQATPAPSNSSRQCIIHFNPAVYKQWCKTGGYVGSGPVPYAAVYGQPSSSSSSSSSPSSAAAAAAAAHAVAASSTFAAPSAATSSSCHAAATSSSSSSSSSSSIHGPPHPSSSSVHAASSVPRLHRKRKQRPTNDDGEDHSEDEVIPNPQS